MSKLLNFSEIEQHHIQHFIEMMKDMYNVELAFGLRLDLDKEGGDVLRLICIRQKGHVEFNCGVFHCGADTLFFKWNTEELCKNVSNMLEQDNWKWIENENCEMYFTCFGMGMHGPPFWLL